MDAVKFLKEKKRMCDLHTHAIGCDFCKYRYSWGCDDGLPYPENGCEDFALDKSTLSDQEQRMFVLNEIFER